MFYFFDILKVRSLIAALNTYGSNIALFTDDNSQKPLFSQLPTLLHFTIATDEDIPQWKKVDFHQAKFFVPPDKEQYKMKFKISAISILRSMNCNLEIFLIRKRLIKTSAIKWLPAFYE